MKLFKSQQGLVPILLLYIATMGIVFYILIASVLPLANKRLIIFHPKPVSQASTSPIVFKSSEGEVLPVNAVNIPLTSSADVKIELTSTIGSPVASASATPEASSSAETEATSGSEPDVETNTGTIHYRIAESSEELDDAEYESYIQEPTIIDYTFDDTLGSKYIWVEFKDSEGRTDRKAAQIELISAPSPTPEPTQTPTPKPLITKTPTPSPTPVSKPTIKSTPKATPQARTTPFPQPTFTPPKSEQVIIPPPSLPSVSLEEESPKAKDCNILCQLGGLISNFNKILEQRMEQLLSRFGILR